MQALVVRVTLLNAKFISRSAVTDLMRSEHQQNALQIKSQPCPLPPATAEVRKYVGPTRRPISASVRSNIYASGLSISNHYGECVANVHC